MGGNRRSSVRMLMGTVAAVALVPLFVLFWAGWRLRQQETAIAGQQIAQRVETAADLIAAALARAVAASRQRLDARASDWPPSAVAIAVAPNRFDAFPNGRLAWTPETPVLPQAPDSAFAEAEILEFQKADLTAAERLYRQLFHSNNEALRAAAGIRLARVLRAQNRPAEAAAVYRSLTHLDNVAIDGVPASLVALHALEDTASLQLGFRRGRWLLTRPVYTLYAGQAEPDRELLSTAAAQLHEQWKRRPPDATGAALLHAGTRDIAVIHQNAGPEIRALLATPEFVATHWLKEAQQTAAAQRVRFSIGEPIQGAVRKAADTLLPWDLSVASADAAAELAERTGRQRLLDGGFLLLTVLTLAAAVFAIRALHRESRAAQLQSEFVSAVSHEFRTPLTSLRQFTEMLRDGRELSPSRRHQCYDAQARAADRLTRLVESLLDFSRLEAGAHPYRLEPCEAAPFVRRVVAEFNAEIRPTGRAVTLTEGAPAGIQADPEALSLALWNLLDNALKYSPGGQTIEAHVARRDGRVAISVRDRGLGIPRHEQAVIFQRFRRGAQAGILGIKGTGIGLAMAGHIVNAHQGAIELESEPGNGSCFTILLPVKD